MQDELITRFVKTHHKFSRLKFNQMKGPLAQGEFVILCSIRDLTRNGKKAQVTDLARRTDVAVPSVSRTLNTLEEKGLVKRRMDETNRRKIYVELTEEGIREQKKVKELFEHMLHEVLDQMGEEKVRQFIDLQEEMLSCIKIVLERRMADE